MEGKSDHGTGQGKKGHKRGAGLLNPPLPSAARMFMTNFYKVKLLGSEEDSIQRYSVTMEPAIPDVAHTLRTAIVRKARRELEKKIGFFVFHNSYLYTRKKNALDITVTTEHDHILYRLRARWSLEVKCGDPEHVQFLKRFFKALFGCLKLQPSLSLSFSFRIVIVLSTCA